MKDEASSSSLPKVGIFVPCYNLGEYIEEAIESLEKQSFRDFQVIIADDASTDVNTLKKLSSLSLSDNYTVFYEKNNLGMNKITNKYAQRLKNEYLLIFSADDKLEVDFLKETVANLESNPAHSAVCTWLKYFSEGQGVREYRQEDTVLSEMLKQNNFSGSALMRKSMWDSLGGYDESAVFRMHQDYDFWLSALESGHKLAVIEKPLFQYRILGSSLSRDVDSTKEHEWILKLIENHHASFKEYFPNIIAHHYSRVIESNLTLKKTYSDYQKLNEKYQKTVEILDNVKITNKQLNHANKRLYRFSPNRLYALIKRLLSGLAR